MNFFEQIVKTLVKIKISKKSFLGGIFSFKKVRTKLMNFLQNKCIFGVFLPK
jgi:hypothetical protein